MVHFYPRYCPDSVLSYCHALTSKMQYFCIGTVPSTHKFTLARECIACRTRVQLALDTRAVASVTQISIYGIATDDYVSFKLLIVNVFVPAVLL